MLSDFPGICCYQYLVESVNTALALINIDIGQFTGFPSLHSYETNAEFRLQGGDIARIKA